MNRFVWVLLVVGCGQREVLDIGNPCFSMPEELPGIVEIEVTTTGGAVGGDCSLVETSEGTWLLETSFLYDREPPFAGQTMAIRYHTVHCAAEIDGGDPIVVEFRGDTEDVPVDGEQHCFVQTYEGGFEPAPENTALPVEGE